MDYNAAANSHCFNRAAKQGMNKLQFQFKTKKINR